MRYLTESVLLFVVFLACLLIYALANYTDKEKRNADVSDNVSERIYNTDIDTPVKYPNLKPDKSQSDQALEL